jgi:hypothetical protein
MIDLHMHTTFSDGRLTVEEILIEAQKQNLVAISITDHDGVGAYGVLRDPKIRALYSGKVIVGTELSCHVDGVPTHILGYGFDFEKLAPKIEEFACRDWSKRFFRKLCAKLSGWGIEINMAYVNGENVCRVLLDLHDEGRLPQKIDFEGAPNRVSRLWWGYLMNKSTFLYIDTSDCLPSPQTVIDAIRDCGGIAILAHPGQYYQFADAVVDALWEKVDGIECYHYAHDKRYRNKLIKFCKAKNLIITGGSDFHGPRQRINNEKVPKDLLMQHPCLMGDY